MREFDLVIEYSYLEEDAPGGRDVSDFRITVEAMGEAHAFMLAAFEMAKVGYEPEDLTGNYRLSCGQYETVGTTS